MTDTTETATQPPSDATPGAAAATEPAPDATIRPDPLILTANTMGRDLMAAMLSELRNMPDHWLRMPEDAQQKAIDRIRGKVAQMVNETLAHLMRAEYPMVQASVDSVLFRGGIRASLKISKTEKARHEFADCEGSTVVVIMAKPDQWLQRMDEIKASADQLALFDGDYDPAQDQPLYRRDQDQVTLTGKSWAELKAQLEAGQITPEEAADLGFNADQPPAEGEDAPLLFGSSLTQAQEREAAISELLEGLTAARVTISKGALYALSPAELTVTREWLKAYQAFRAAVLDNPMTAEPCAMARPLWIPRPDESPETGDPAP